MENKGVIKQTETLKEQNKVTKKQKLENKIIKLKKQYKDLYCTDSSVKPMLTEKNIEALLYNLNICVKFNEITKTVYIENFDKLDENKNENCSTLKKFASFLEDEIVRQDFQSKSFETLYRKLDSIAYKNSYNPIKDYLISNYDKNKDKITKNFNNINYLIDILKVRNSDKNITKMLVKKWLISCVASQLDDNFVSHGILTLTGDQGIGKTSFFRMLIPETLLLENKKKDGYFKDGYRLDLKNKDSLIEFLQYWIVELGELDSTAKNQISELKAFTTKKYDTFRSPFGRTNLDYKRTTIACASIDKEKFLRDDANRRFWVIDCIDIDYKKSIDIDLVWAELTKLFYDGEISYLTKDEIKILNEHNRNFNMSTETDSIIESCFDWNSKERYYLSSSDIYLILSSNNKNLTTTKIGIALKKMKIEYKEKSARRKMYKMPKPFRIAVKEDILTCWKYEKCDNEINLKKIPKPIEGCIISLLHKACVDDSNYYKELIELKRKLEDYDLTGIEQIINNKINQIKVNRGEDFNKIIEKNIKKAIEFIDSKDINLEIGISASYCNRLFKVGDILFIPNFNFIENKNMVKNYYSKLNLNDGMSIEHVCKVLDGKSPPVDSKIDIVANNINSIKKSIH
jgi:predicted P-loop ATPase